MLVRRLNVKGKLYLGLDRMTFGYPSVFVRNFPSKNSFSKTNSASPEVYRGQRASK